MKYLIIVIYIFCTLNCSLYSMLVFENSTLDPQWQPKPFVWDPSQDKVFDLEQCLKKNQSLDKEKETIRVIFLALSNNRFDVVKKELDDFPHLVDAKENAIECTPLYQASSSGNVQFCSLFLQLKANVNCENSDKNTPLHVATDNDIIEMLLQAGADIHKKNNDGETPLLYQIRCNPNGVSLLLKHGANIHDVNNNGCNVLHTAMIQDSWGIIEILLKAGVDPALCDNDGRYPLEYGIYRSKVMKYFTEYGFIVFNTKKGGCCEDVYSLLTNNAQMLKRLDPTTSTTMWVIDTVLHDFFECIDRWDKVRTPEMIKNTMVKRCLKTIILRYPTCEHIKAIFGADTVLYARRRVAGWFFPSTGL